MKRKTFLVAVVAILAISSCSKENRPESNTVGGVTNLMNGGTWRISYYYDDNDETANFEGFDFSFGKNDELTAELGSTSNTGIWTITDSNSDDDDLNELHFNISFLSPPNFEELSDDWQIIEKNSSTIKLNDVSGGNGDTDYLTFTKN